MRRKAIYHYYVEGEDEKKLFDTLKKDLGCIESGKVDKMNVIQTRFTVARIRPLKQDTIVVLVYDTDVENNMDILQDNIKFLNNQRGIKEVICIPQVKNLEDELLRACDVKNIKELTKSISKSNYKNDLINCTNLGARLKACKFDISKMWNQMPVNSFKNFGNHAEKIKISN